MRTPRIIAVVGGGNPGEATVSLAAQLGQAIVQDDILVTGGDGGQGTPRAVKDAAIVGARQHKAGGGKLRIVSILRGNAQTSPSLKQTNVLTAVGHGRNIFNAALCDAMIVLKGEAGTLSEAAFAHLLGRRVIFLEDIKDILTSLSTEDFQTVAADCKAVESVVQVDCDATVIRALARAAWNNGTKVSTIHQAVNVAAAAPLTAFWPAQVAKVDISELLSAYGRTLNAAP